MPHFTLAVSADGPIVIAYVGVSASRRQALLAAHQPVPNAIQIRALIDTGASCSCVDAATLAPLGLAPTGQTTVTTPTTGQNAATMDEFDVLMAVPGRDENATPLIFSTIPIVALQDFGNAAYSALIGRDILRDCILHYNGSTGLFELSF